MSRVFCSSSFLVAALANLVFVAQSSTQGLRSADLSRFRSVGEIQFSPDARSIAYTVSSYDQLGRPASQVWIMDVVGRKATRLGGEKQSTPHPRWSPDGKWICYSGRSPNAALCTSSPRVSAVASDKHLTFGRASNITRSDNICNTLTSRNCDDFRMPIESWVLF
jgi:Tol biopolymer transport system component